ncbi:hypothetical protein PLICRDRAFT_143931 [Plicaturopsis crispa FD-325 SS-3]|nr:hypothetical protein PLICRDRAFT_143931 [Plicaturopsis crispa FD-325 SS-3]
MPSILVGAYETKAADGLKCLNGGHAQNATHISSCLPGVSSDNEERLRILIRVADVLGLDELSFLTYSSAITRLSSDELAVKRSLNHLKYAEHRLSDHLASVRHEEQLITKWTDVLQADQETGETASSLERRKEAMIKKAKEYQRELETLKNAMPYEPTVTISDLMAQQARIRQKEQELKVKRAKVKAFQGLPPNLGLAKLKLLNARNEQMELIQLRERLLGKMADGVA